MSDYLTPLSQARRENFSWVFPHTENALTRSIVVFRSRFFCCFVCYSAASFSSFLFVLLVLTRRNILCLTRRRREENSKRKIMISHKIQLWNSSRTHCRDVLCLILVCFSHLAGGLMVCSYKFPLGWFTDMRHEECLIVCSKTTTDLSVWDSSSLTFIDTLCLRCHVFFSFLIASARISQDTALSFPKKTINFDETFFCRLESTDT